MPEQLNHYEEEFIAPTTESESVAKLEDTPEEASQEVQLVAENEKPLAATEEARVVIEKTRLAIEQLKCIGTVRITDATTRHEEFLSIQQEINNIDLATAEELAHTALESGVNAAEEMKVLLQEMETIRTEITNSDVESGAAEIEHMQTLALQLSETITKYQQLLEAEERAQSQYFAAEYQKRWHRDSAEVIAYKLPPLQPGESFDERRRKVYEEAAEEEKRTLRDKIVERIPLTKEWIQRRARNEIERRTANLSSDQYKKYGIESIEWPGNSAYQQQEVMQKASVDAVTEIFNQLVAAVAAEYQQLTEIYEQDSIHQVEKAGVAYRLFELLSYDEELRQAREDIRDNLQLSDYSSNLRYGIAGGYFRPEDRTRQLQQYQDNAAISAYVLAYESYENDVEDLIAHGRLDLETLKVVESSAVPQYILGFTHVDGNRFSTEIEQRHPEHALIFKLANDCPQLFKPSNSGALAEIRWNYQKLVTNEKDIQFIKTILDQYGNAAPSIISGYVKCVDKGVVSKDERQLVLDFLKEFRVVGVEVLSGYIQARKEKNEAAYINQLKEFAAKVIGTTSLEEKDRALPYYRELLQHIFQNNSGVWGKFSDIEVCSDRQADLAEFSYQERYNLTTIDAGEMKIKEGIDADTLENYVTTEKANLYELSQLDEAALQQSVATTVDQLMAQLPEGTFSEMPETINEKFALLLACRESGAEQIDDEILEEALWRFAIHRHGDHQATIASLIERSEKSPNPEYSFLTELHNLSFDRRKEALRAVFAEAAASEKLAPVFETFHLKTQQRRQEQARENVRNRLKGKYGVSPAFINQVGERLYGKQLLQQHREELGRDVVDDHIAKIITRYERLTNNFSAEKTSSNSTRTKQIYGMLRSRRVATDQVLENHQANDIPSIPLTRVDDDFLRSLAHQEDEPAEYNPERYFSNLGQQAMRLSNDRLSQTEQFLNQFESTTGKERQVTWGYFTKTKEASLARMVGGVCVSQDNPLANSERPNLWEMPNYFQFVLQDPDTLRCQGLLLLHHFTEPDGTRILTVSFNPSQGFLQTADETTVFKALKDVVTDFASENNFDLVGISTNSSIRTNRTGGVFERTMTDEIAAAGQQVYKFQEPKTFSYSPAYSMDTVNVLWRREENT